MFRRNRIPFRLVLIFLVSTFYTKAQVITQTVTYAAGLQTLAIPACVPFVTITCYGASGADGALGSNGAPGGVGGKGAIVRGVYPITPTASVLNIYTGGAGTGTLGGFNGGGSAGNGLGIGGAGGGSTDVRVGGIAIANRIIVAGGGGGGGNAGCATTTIGGGNGGNGGGSAGLNGSSITSGTDIVTGGFGGVGQTAGTLVIGCSTLVTAATNGAGTGSGVGGKGGFSSSTLCCCSSLVSGGGGGGGYRGGGGGSAGAIGSTSCILTDRASGGGGAGGTNFFATGFTSTLVSVASFTGNGFVEITYQTVPIPTITVNSGTICEGSAFTIVPSGAASYIYQGGSASVSPPSTSIYTVVGNNGLSCASAPVSSTVTVIPRPVLSISSANNPICSSTSYIAAPAGANIYTFSIGPTSIIGTTANIPGPTNTTTLNIVGTNTLTSCVSLPISVVFTVIPRPVVTVNSGSICAGDTYSIVPSGAVTYSIQGGSFAVSPTVTTNYSVTGTGTNGCVSLPAISNVSVAPLPNIGIQSSASLICIGQSAVLTPSGAVTYSISGGNFTISPTVTTSYTVQATAASSCSNSVVYTQNVSACTSLQAPSQNLENIKVYPNPVHTFLTIEVNATSSTTLEIINPLGQVIERLTLKEPFYQLNMAELESGLYLVKLNQSNEQRIIKVIKN